MAGLFLCFVQRLGAVAGPSLRIARPPTDGRAFVFSTKGHKLQHKGKTKAITIPDIEFVGWVPGALVIVAEHRNTVRCDDGTYRAALYTVRTP